jgi:hypothetical protein
MPKVEPDLYSAMMMLWSLVAVEGAPFEVVSRASWGLRANGARPAHRRRRGLGSGTNATSMRVNNVYAFVD